MKEENEFEFISEKEITGKRFAYLCYSIFLEGLGKELMDKLDVILRSPVAPYKEAAPYAYYREGQNDIIRRLKAGIALHEQLLRGEHDKRGSSINTGSPVANKRK